ncbi:MAG TPA: hypothetical protein DCY72_01865 [Ruminococcaceae bacterium]|nr:hypothetical protein [Oscillospiraceae bacterium]
MNMDLQKLAYDYVKIIFNKYISDGNYMGFYLLYYGKAIYKVEAFPGAGHNYYAILDGVYRYARETRTDNFQDIFERSLSFTIDSTFYPNDVSLFCNYLVTEINNEISGKSPFSIDVDRVLDHLKKRAEEYELLRNDPSVKREIIRTQEIVTKKR